MTDPWKDPAVLGANVSVALEALDRMIGLEDHEPDGVRYRQAYRVLQGWLEERGCPSHGTHPHNGKRCLDCPTCTTEANPPRGARPGELRDCSDTLCAKARPHSHI